MMRTARGGTACQSGVLETEVCLPVQVAYEVDAATGEVVLETITLMIGAEVGVPLSALPVHERRSLEAVAQADERRKREARAIES